MNISEILNILELPLNSFKLNNQLTYDQAVEELNKFKELVKKQRNKLAFKYHPDINPELNNEKMKEVNQAVDVINKLSIQRPRPVNIVQFIYKPTGVWSRYGSTSGTNTTGYSWATNNYTTTG